MILLPNKIAHIWLLDFRTIDDSQLEAFKESLSEDELERLERFSNARLRRKQLITRMGVRSCLSQYSDSISPKDWEFEQDANGKPMLKAGSEMDLSFNLSHSGDWLVVATTVDTQIGVDLQQRSYQQPLTDLAERFFHPEEAKALAEAEGDWQEAQFFRFWTLKEAYLKARGLGIVGGLEKARFQLDNNGLVTAEFDPALKDDPSDWQFHHFDLEDNYSLALALHQPRAQHASPHFYKFVPGGMVVPLERRAHEILVR